MPASTWQGVLWSAAADGTALNTSTSEVSLLNAESKYTLPANFLMYPGQTLRVRAMGRVSNIVTTPGTLTLRVKFNTTPIAVAASQAMQLNAVAKTNVTWILDWDLTLRSRGGGTAATFMHSGMWTSEAVVGSGTGAAGSTGPGQFVIPASAPAVGTGFDSTVANLVDLTGQFSINNAANSIQLHSFKLESIN
jgi:hypothetical protein